MGIGRESWQWELDVVVVVVAVVVAVVVNNGTTMVFIHNFICRDFAICTMSAVQEATS